MTLTGGGVASYPMGHLGSGSYLFTSLYSGNSNFQPTTVSGSSAAVTVLGTPVTLSLSPSSVAYGSTLRGDRHRGRKCGYRAATHRDCDIYIDNGGTPIAIGTTTALVQVGGGNTSSRTVTITATAPNLNIGSYELYAIFNPTNGTYHAGSSSDEPLTVTTIPTSTDISCSVGSFGGNCTSTTTVTATGAPVSGREYR